VSSFVRLRIDLAYDGSGFRGWARQDGLRTVQGELEGALDTVLRASGTVVTVAGRTDSGVHARGQVAHVDLDPEALDAVSVRGDVSSEEALLRRLNGVIAADLRVRRIRPAPDGFDARYSAVWRRYCYRIADAPVVVDPLTRGHVVAWPRPLDLDRMNEAAALLVGLHDFASFCKKREGATTIRSLLDLSWTRVDGVAEATVRADAFCHNMVRSLVGCMIAIGEGRRDPAWAGDVLSRAARDSAVTVAHAHGLTLEEVGYPADDELAAQAESARARRTLPA
jgi:tRNA pseudouridine38-40 synthase